MRTFIFLLTLLVVSACTALAQGNPCISPAASATTYLGTYTVTQTVPTPDLVKGRGKPKKSPKGRHTKKHLGGEGQAVITLQVCIWRNDKGEFHLFQDLNTLSVSDSASLIDTMSTSTLVAVTARSAIAQGITMGIITCTGGCSTPNTAVVWQSQCVTRTGSGSTTHLTPCGGSGNCSRTYTYCCPSTPATPLIVPQPAPGPSGCTTPGCQPTCF